MVQLFVSIKIFAVALVLAILFSGVVASVVATELNTNVQLIQGEKGDKGDTGDTGPLDLRVLLVQRERLDLQEQQVLKVQQALLEELD